MPTSVAKTKTPTTGAAWPWALFEVAMELPFDAEGMTRAAPGVVRKPRDASRHDVFLWHAQQVETSYALIAKTIGFHRGEFKGAVLNAIGGAARAIKADARKLKRAVQLFREVPTDEHKAAAQAALKALHLSCNAYDRLRMHRPPQR